ncbi:MAG: hypothetical protein RBS40_15500 [Rhodocyclaceae bacterium]|jgi:pimeloyl-ACP methyl ester carboxylesterase|nr:hypothetical protein [Rhodocyclaceae bacterium]
MAIVSDYLSQAELALAAYADLTGPASGYKTALEAVGVASPQADALLSNYTVVEQYTDSTGLSATVFEDGGGKKYLAIRGTEPEANDLITDGLLGLGLPASLIPQFAALKAHLDTVWLADGGKLHGETFTVTGHSLGGFLAVGIAAQFATQVSHAYLYNSPGLGGVLGSFNPILRALGVMAELSPTRVSNLKAEAGPSLIAGLGYQVSPSVPVEIENQSAPGISNPPPSGNHSIQVLTDALAVQAAFARLDPTLTQAQLNTLVDFSGTHANDVLEASLDGLRQLLLGPDVTATPADNRDSFYANLYDLQGSAAYGALSGNAQITVLSTSNAASIKDLAANDTDLGLATRYALTALNPFVLTGIDYSSFNTDGALDRYRSENTEWRIAA